MKQQIQPSVRLLSSHFLKGHNAFPQIRTCNQNIRLGPMVNHDSWILSTKFEMHIQGHKFQISALIAVAYILYYM